MQDDKDLVNTTDHFSIKKKHLTMLVMVLICIGAATLAILFSNGLKIGFGPKLDEENSAEMKSRLGALENKLNDSIKQLNEIILLKEKLEKQVPTEKQPASSDGGKGGIFIALEPLSIEKEANNSVSNAIDRIDQRITSIDKSIPRLKEPLSLALVSLSNLPNGVPLAGPYSLSSLYGVRVDPLTNRGALHSGVDFSAPIGTPVLSAAPGVVTKVVEGDIGYGNFIEITHPKNIVTKYAHLNEILVRPYQTLNKGDLIGTVGNTGRSSGPHLHFEILAKGEFIDPMGVISPYPVKANVGAIAIYSASVKAKCANLKLIIADENSPIMQECLRSGGKNANEIMLAKRAQENLKTPKTNGFPNHCYKVDQENRLIVGTKSACETN